MKRIYGLIRKLGATSKYKGYFFVAEAVKISMRHQYKPMHITKDIYPCLATKYKSTPTNIEHDIRTLINVCWMRSRDILWNTSLPIVSLLICLHIIWEKWKKRTDYSFSKSIWFWFRKWRIISSQNCSGCLVIKNVLREVPVVQRSALFLNWRFK